MFLTSLAGQVKDEHHRLLLLGMGELYGFHACTAELAPQRVAARDGRAILVPCVYRKGSSR